MKQASRQGGAPPSPVLPSERERQVTMFNRKAVVVLAGIAAMTVMVITFALNTPPRGAEPDAVPAEQAGHDAARPNYLASPPDTGRTRGLRPPASSPEHPSLQPGAPAVPPPPEPAQAPVPGAGLDPYAGATFASGPPVQPAAPAPRQSTPREESFLRAMRCGIRSCAASAVPDEPAGGPADWSSEAQPIPPGNMVQADGALPQAAGPAASGTAPGSPSATGSGAAGERDNGPRVAARIERPGSPFQIMAGTLIPVTLVTALNSDLPGEVVAQVTRNVYDTQQRHLLIPAGSRVLGRVDGQVQAGQARVDVAWHRIVFPNSNSVTLPGFRGVDGQGASGIRDRVNNHYGRTYLNAALLSAITAGAQLSQPRTGGSESAPAAGQVAAGALGQQMGEVSGEMIRRNMQAGPTLEVRPGFQFSVFVSRDLVLEPYDHYGMR